MEILIVVAILIISIAAIKNNKSSDALSGYKKYAKDVGIK